MDHHRTSVFAILYGWKNQSIYYDFDQNKCDSTGKLDKLGGILLALDKNAKIRIKESENKDEKIVTLKKGEVFLFLGNLFHQGAGYETLNNPCFHCK